MNISKNQEGTKLTLALEGRLDTSTAPSLEQEINSISGDVTELVVDMEKLEYVSSAGLRALLSAHKKMSKAGGLKVVKANEMVKSVFEVTGFNNVLNIE